MEEVLELEGRIQILQSRLRKLKIGKKALPR
jgi:uncharacterized protein with PhoU and TrkA domain